MCRSGVQTVKVDTSVLVPAVTKSEDGSKRRSVWTHFAALSPFHLSALMAGRIRRPVSRRSLSISLRKQPICAFPTKIRRGGITIWDPWQDCSIGSRPRSPSSRLQGDHGRIYHPLNSSAVKTGCLVPRMSWSSGHLAIASRPGCWPRQRVEQAKSPSHSQRLMRQVKVSLIESRGHDSGGGRPL